METEDLIQRFREMIEYKIESARCLQSPDHSESDYDALYAHTDDANDLQHGILNGGFANFDLELCQAIGPAACIKIGFEVCAEKHFTAWEGLRLFTKGFVRKMRFHYRQVS